MTTRLNSEDHQKVRKLILKFEKGDDDTKQVYIRDGLDEIFAPHLMQWRLLQVTHAQSTAVSPVVPR